MKFAVVQSLWVEDPAEGLQRAIDAMTTACQDADVDLVCFPEFFLGPPWYMPGQDGLKGQTDSTVPGPVVEKFQALARETATNILLGSMVEDLEDGMYRNTSLLIDRTGEITHAAVKAHAFGNEMVVCRQAESLGVMDSEFGPLGVAVCSDFWIPEVIRLLAVAGAKVIIVPGGTLRQNQNLMVNALTTAAYLNGVTLIYASSVGVVRGMRGDRLVEVQFAGTSLVALPDGRLLAQAGTEEPEVMIVTLDRDEAQASGVDGQGWLAMRRPAAYSGLLDGYVGAKRDLAEELRMSIAGPPGGAPASRPGAVKGAQA